MLGSPIQTNLHEKTKLNFTNWLFIFVSSYFLLYCNADQFLTSFLFEWIYTIVVPPFANLFGVDDAVRIERTGSGDTPFHYYKNLFKLFVAFAGSFLILFIVRKPNYIKIFKKTAYMFARYYLLYMMLIYGLAKVFYLQFPYPNESILERTLGDKSPMGLMWTFMGYSMGYTMFVGWLELISGLFLIFRKTTILGALMSFGVMLNVFVLNMFYDVPVKLLSLHLVLLSLYILYPVAKEIGSFFFSRGNVERGKMPFFDYGPASSTMLIAKVCLLIFTLFRMGSANYASFKATVSSESNFFTGKHIINEYKIVNEVGELESAPQYKSWRSITSVNAEFIAVALEDGDKEYYEVDVDEELQTIDLRLSVDSVHQKLNYSLDQYGRPNVLGRLYGDSISMQLIKSNNTHVLSSRGFHWVQEYPYNR